MRPQIVKKESWSGGGRQWGPRVNQLVIELLSHNTPPSYVAANILSVTKYIHPDNEVTVELPSVRFIFNTRTTWSSLSKLIAANKLGLAPKFLQHHSGGTKWRQTNMENVVIKIPFGDDGYENVVLDSCILPVDETAEMSPDAILRAFQQGRRKIAKWRKVTAREYHNRQDLLDRIALEAGLSVSKLANRGNVMTDTCNTARKFRRLLAKQ